MRVRVRLFASLRERAGFDEREMDLPEGATAADLWERLRAGLRAEGEPVAAPLVAVGEEHAHPGRVLREGDRVAFFPPVSGGADDGPPRLVPRALGPADVDALVRAVASPERGGTAVFVGTVRREGSTREVVSIEYEAYPEMAVREMERVEAEASARFPGARVRLAHSTGPVAPGDASVAVAAAAAHRAEAFEACRFSIDRLKEIVPIWKKERYADGGSAWSPGG